MHACTCLCTSICIYVFVSLCRCISMHGCMRVFVMLCLLAYKLFQGSCALPVVSKHKISNIYLVSN